MYDIFNNADSDTTPQLYKYEHTHIFHFLVPCETLDDLTVLKYWNMVSLYEYFFAHMLLRQHSSCNVYVYSLCFKSDSF